MIYYFVKCDCDGNLSCDDFHVFSNEPFFFRMEFLSSVVTALNKTTTKDGEYFFWTKRRDFNHIRVAK